jgi:hypothetical protein
MLRILAGKMIFFKYWFYLKNFIFSRNTNRLSYNITRLWLCFPGAERHLLWFFTLEFIQRQVAKVAVVRDSHKLFLSLTGEFEWKFSRLPFIYCLLPQTFHSNSSVRLKKKLVGISHYGHFRFSFFTGQAWQVQGRGEGGSRLGEVGTATDRLGLPLRNRWPSWDWFLPASQDAGNGIA